ncbi:MAG: hypothetical protein AB7S75_21890 [Desulfococcaceae bacterium]
MENKRLEFLIEEAGCLIWLAPRSLGGLTPAQFAQVWMGESQNTVKNLVREGAMMPMGLYQDDGYIVRFIIGDLNQQEESEWTARVRWKLAVPCGKMLISGILTPDFDDDFSDIILAENGGSYQAGCYVEVPPQTYQVEVYSYPPGDLSGGWGMIENPGTFGKNPMIKPENPVNYFRRTRPGEKIPLWIEDQFEEVSYVNFAVRILPLTEEISQPDLENDGCIKWEFRKPGICPLGIRSIFQDM